MVEGRRIAEQVVERVQRDAAPDGCLPFDLLPPSLKSSMPFRLGPEELQPVGVVVGDGGVVERLRVKGIGATLDQQGGEVLRVRVRRLVAFTLADHPGQHRKGRLAPRSDPEGVGIGAVVQQPSRDLYAIRLAAGQVRIG